jgi:hypothetical protein
VSLKFARLANGITLLTALPSGRLPLRIIAMKASASA